MADPRIVKLARLMVTYSTRIGKGDRVAIEAQPVAEPLVMALYENILEAGGHPHVLITLPGEEEMLIKKGSDVQLDFPPTFRALAYDTFESRIRVYSESNTRSLSNVDLRRYGRHASKLGKILKTQMERGARGEFRWLSTLFPTDAYAQDAEMSLTEYQDFVYQACHVDDPAVDAVAYWEGVKAEQQGVVKAFRGHDRLVVRGPNCELKLSVKDRVFLNACGDHNMPDGEVFSGPVEKSVEGWIRFNFPAVYQGREVDGVELRFREGRVEHATASKDEAYLLEMLDSDPGARYLGEFAVGTNFGIQRFTRNILFDEKIGGSIHVALGSGYPETGNTNKSAIHWDMICDMRDGEILADGTLIYKDGRFQV
jgi:aminopeptidase